MNIRLLTLVTAIIVVLAGLGFYLFNRNQQQTQTPSPSATSSFDGTINYTDQPAIGEDSASVKVAAFEDLKCPACRNFEEFIYPQLERDYIRTGKIKFHFINFAIPLGPDSVTAALAGECAFEQSNAVFWEYKTILYRSQGPESQRWATVDKLIELAKTYVPDLKTDELKTCIEDERYLQRVQDDRAMGVAAGVQGTPTLFVNNQAITNALDYTTVKTALDAALNQ